LKRSGFSLIELVLSIVIIAISLMSVPMLLSQSSKSNQYALIQESVMAARTKIGNILTFQWDNNSTSYDLSHSSTIDGVLVMDVRNGDDEFNRTSPTAFRKGHVSYKNKGRRRMYRDVVYASAIGKEGAEFDDLDDFDGIETSVTLTDGIGEVGDFDYLGISKLKIKPNINFLNDDANYSNKHIAFSFDVANKVGKNSNQSTNIKMIELSVESEFRSNPFILRAFSSNIGGISKLYSQEK
jgi:prepilin-type N-terminal cleavage/methylation domain-containing protein